MAAVVQPHAVGCDIDMVRDGKFLLSNLSNGMIQSRVLMNRRPLKLDTRNYDFLIVQDPRPFRLTGETWQIVRYHDLIPLIRPDTIATPGTSSGTIGPSAATRTAPCSSATRSRPATT